MGALTAYVRVRLCCSLCHDGRRAHHSLPHRKKQNGWLHPANENENRMEGGGGFVKEEQVRRQIKGLIRKINSEEKTKR